MTIRKEIKIRAEINEIVSKKWYERSMNPKVGSFKRKTRLTNLYPNSSLGNMRERTQINKMRNER